MLRTIQRQPTHRQDVVLDADRPLSDVHIDRAVLPGSLQVSVNGMLIPRSMWAYNSGTRTVTVNSLLLKGDTISTVGTLAGDSR